MAHLAEVYLSLAIFWKKKCFFLLTRRIIADVKGPAGFNACHISGFKPVSTFVGCLL
tara:strand:- start:396 stop:566 length:171 start_codon:yes stop_codon:yes gene_type:complete